MAGKKVQVPVLGGLRKVIQIPTSQNVGTTIQEFGSQVVSLAQLKAALGITGSTVPATAGGSLGGASLIVGPGLSGGGVLTGAVNLSLLQPIPPVIWNDALLPDDWVGSGGSGGGGSSTLAGLSDVTISSPSLSQVLAYNGTKWQNTTLSAGSAGANVTPDTHPTVPSNWDDEFEFGSTLDTSGSRRASAVPWSVLGGGGTPTVATVTNGAFVFGFNSNSTIIYTQSLSGITAPYAFTIKIALAPIGAPANFMNAGIFLRNSSTGKLLSWHPLYSSGWEFEAFEWTNYTINTGIFTGNPLGLTTWLSGVYLTIAYDGTNIACSASGVGATNTFYTHVTQAASSWVGTPDTVGIMLNNNSAGTFNAAVDWFRRTA